jgi:hypothetical protein
VVENIAVYERMYTPEKLLDLASALVEDFEGAEAALTRPDKRYLRAAVGNEITDPDQIAAIDKVKNVYFLFHFEQGEERLLPFSKKRHGYKTTTTSSAFAGTIPALWHRSHL